MQQVVPCLLTVRETATVLKVTPRTLFRWLAEGQLGAVRIGHTTRIRSEDLQAFIDQHVTTSGKDKARPGA
jgi:excisionase family DNA binding protein